MVMINNESAFRRATTDQTQTLLLVKHFLVLCQRQVVFGFEKRGALTKFFPTLCGSFCLPALTTTLRPPFALVFIFT